MARSRQLASHSDPWVQSFACEHAKVLIVCRGPVRREAIEIFREMGVMQLGILLSEKDSIVYAQSQAPEFRLVPQDRAHPIADYTGATATERLARIEDILNIARTHGYTHIFAGYGFMSEDASFVAAIEAAGITFVGPSSRVVEAAGAKDQAKRTALQVGVSVTPGIDDLTRRALLAQAPNRDALLAYAGKLGLTVANPPEDLGELADAVWEAGFAAGIDAVSTDALADQVRIEAETLLSQNPGRRFRLKAIGGGGGKGQRIFAKAEDAASLYREVLSEAKATAPGTNKNVLIEQNIEQTRHNEIQLVGNGQWCVSMGGRDCSLQMHEQKLLEVSLTQSALRDEAARRREAGDTESAIALEAQAERLAQVEGEGERFGEAVGLDSVSTFECIVDEQRHYFMEVNTRIQVEHRVSELCYALRFSNGASSFEVDSIIEVMLLLACHGSRLEKPVLVARKGDAVEARLNATDDALRPHAGGIIEAWSPPIDGEIRDDQGIGVPNPDTGAFVPYHIAGAYDSNVALVLSTGESRKASFSHMADVVRRMSLRGHNLSTNLEFHYGLLHYFLSTDVYARPTTRFVAAWLVMVARLAERANQQDVDVAWRAVTQAPPHVDARAFAEVVGCKGTLVTRPVRQLLTRPHLLAAWLSSVRGKFEVNQGVVSWRHNPVEILRDLYGLLGWREVPDVPDAASQRIWDHDAQMLDTALAFYDQLTADRADRTWDAILHWLAQPERRAEIQGAHVGHQVGLELLAWVVGLGLDVGFYDWVPRADGFIAVPGDLDDAAAQDWSRNVLSPPPVQSADRLVAVSGGMYYAQQAPDLPPLVQVGQHVDEGSPIYVIEVMKMFNVVRAPFACTIDRILAPADGTVVKRGDVLFEVTPDIAPDDALPKGPSAEVTLESLRASVGLSR